MTLPLLAEKKRLADPIVMVTAYDYPSARAAEAAGVDLVLVGDSAATTCSATTQPPPCAWMTCWCSPPLPAAGSPLRF